MKVFLLGLVVALSACAPSGEVISKEEGITVVVDSVRHVACYRSGVYGGASISCVAIPRP